MLNTRTLERRARSKEGKIEGRERGEQERERGERVKGERGERKRGAVKGAIWREGGRGRARMGS